jgi:hypothetical protein
MRRKGSMDAFYEVSQSTMPTIQKWSGMQNQTCQVAYWCAAGNKFVQLHMLKVAASILPKELDQSLLYGKHKGKRLLPKNCLRTAIRMFEQLDCFLMGACSCSQFCKYLQ